MEEDSSIVCTLTSETFSFYLEPFYSCGLEFVRIFTAHLTLLSVRVQLASFLFLEMCPCCVVHTEWSSATWCLWWVFLLAWQIQRSSRDTNTLGSTGRSIKWSSTTIPSIVELRWD